MRGIIQTDMHVETPSKVVLLVSGGGRERGG